MINREPWTTHKFNLEIDPGWSHNILSRLTDAEIRLQHHCQNLSESQLTFQPDGHWSIKEHIGHLIDLEVLHSKRLEEFRAFQKILTGADMSNAKTQTANHNDKSLAVLIEEFSKGRAHFIAEYLSMDTTVNYHEALHPRLKVIMKPVDLLFFVAEHDDHHITSILKIKTNG